MTRTVLYYPTINIPDSQWLRQAVLYYENVASIVPELHQGSFPLNPEIILLKDEGIFKEVRPRALFLRYEEYQLFEQTLKGIIESKEFQWALSNEPKMIDSRVHHDKVAASMYDYLSQKGLAKTDPNDQGWYKFERKTALVFMAALALQLANIDDSTIPSTDNSTYHDFLFADNSKYRRCTCSQIIFNNILPVPKPDVPIEKIIQFRKDHDTELYNLRKKIDDFQKEATSANTLEDLRKKGTQHGEEIRSEVNNLKKDLEHENVSSFWHSLSVLLKDIRYKILERPVPVQLVTFGGTVGGAIGGPVGGALGAAIPVAIDKIEGVAEIGISYKEYQIKEQYAQRIKVRENPFGYIYSAKKSGIL